VTEEVWSWWQVGSIHTATWPTPSEFAPAFSGGAPDDSLVLEVAADVLGQIRRAKTTAKRSMRSQVATLTVGGSTEQLAALHSAESDLGDAGSVLSLVTGASDQLTVEVELAAEE
jgi:valyl-tRNA synthetase